MGLPGPQLASCASLCRAMAVMEVWSVRWQVLQTSVHVLGTSSPIISHLSAARGHLVNLSGGQQRGQLAKDFSTSLCPERHSVQSAVQMADGPANGAAYQAASVMGAGIFYAFVVIGLQCMVSRMDRAHRQVCEPCGGFWPVFRTMQYLDVRSDKPLLAESSPAADCSAPVLGELWQLCPSQT